MKTDLVSLARRLRTRSRVARVLAVFLPVAVVAGLVVVPWSIERVEFQRAKGDFAGTWCATFGAEAPDFDSTKAEWTEFVERNRGFLQSNWHILGVDQWRVSSYRANPEYRDVLMLEVDVQSWNQRDDNWPPQWYRGFFPHHFAFFGFPHDGPPSCD